MELENMENTQEQTNQEVNNEGQEQQPTQPVENANSINEGSNGTEQVNQPTNLKEWQKDGRYGKMWKTEDDMYASYKSLEKSSNDINSKYSALIKLLKDNGFQAETFADELKKYADYRDPESRINKIYNYVNDLLSNSIYSPRVQQFFEQIEQEELQRLYPNMSAEQIAKQQQMDKEIKELKQREAQRQAEVDIQNQISTLNKGLAECETLANEYGFKLTDEVKSFLLTKCRDNGVDPKYLKSEFINIYGKQLMEARDKKVKENEQINQKKLKQAQILGGANGSNSVMPNLKGRAAFTEGLKRILGK